MNPGGGRDDDLMTPRSGWSGRARGIRVVVGAFPDGQSCLNLAAARLRHIAGTQWSTRKYMNMAPLRAAKNEAYGAVIA